MDSQPMERIQSVRAVLPAAVDLTPRQVLGTATRRFRNDLHATFSTRDVHSLSASGFELMPHFSYTGHFRRQTISAQRGCFEKLEDRRLLATQSLSGLLGHTNSVTFDTRVLSNVTSSQLVYDVLRDGLAAPGNSQAGHDLEIIAQRADGASFSATRNTGNSTLSIGVNVDLNPGANVFTSIFRRIGAGQLSLNPTISVVRNQRPVAVDQSVTTSDDGSITVVLAGPLDADGDAVTATITSLPSAGTLRRTNGAEITAPGTVLANRSVVFVAEANQPSTSFNFRLNDTFEDSVAAGAVNVTVTDVAPAAPGAPTLQPGFDTSAGFVVGGNGDQLTRGLPNVGGDPFLQFDVDGIELGASVQLFQDGAPVGSPAADNDADGTAAVAVPLTAGSFGTFQFTATQSDPGNNTSNASAAASINVDLREPTVADVALGGVDVLSGAQSTIPVGLMGVNDPTVSFTVDDQRFAPVDNPVQVSVEVDGSPVSSEVRTFTTLDLAPETYTVALGGLGVGEHTATITALDAAGNSSSTAFTFFLLGTAGEATAMAPNTPVYTEYFALPTELTSFLGSAKPWQTTLDKTTQTTWFTLENGNGVAQFDPATGKLLVYRVDFAGAATGPHGIFFDLDTHLTPRIWFAHTRNARNGGKSGRISYIDLTSVRDGSDSFVTRLVTFDIDLPEFGEDGQPEVDEFGQIVHSEVGAHAVFVDTRGRVWVTAEEADAVLELDFTRFPNGQFTRNLDSTNGRMIVHKIPGTIGDRQGLDIPFHIHGVKTVVDDATGEAFVWVTAAGDGQQLKGAGRLALLKPTESMLLSTAESGISKIVVSAPLPPNTTVVLSPGGSAEEQVVVEEVRTIGSLQEVTLRDPIQNAHPAGTEIRGPDAWFEFDFDEELDADLGVVGDNDFRPAHSLFVEVDDAETPGIPSDDKIVVSDPGFLSKLGAAGTIRVVEPGNLIRALQENLALPASSTVSTVRVPKTPGTSFNRPSPFASTQQSFVDRGGEVFFVDALGGVGRFHPSDQLDPEIVSRRESPIRPATASFPPVLQLVGELGPETTQIVETFQANLQPSTLDDQPDLASLRGLDQYTVSREGNNPNDARGGPFRGVINASNVLFGALSQKDFLSRTVFAETTRRQMSVVPSPFANQDNGIVEGRMAFQTLRDGSLVLTGRGDGELLDDQINLSRLLADVATPFADLAIVGDPSAVVFNDDPPPLLQGQGVAKGHVFVFGKAAGGRLVVYAFRGDWSSTASLLSRDSWSIEFLDAPTGRVLVGDPQAYVDGDSNVAVLLTADDGRLLRYEARGANRSNVPIELTTAADPSVYARVDVVQQGGLSYVYGTDQQGNLVELSFPWDLPASDPHTAVTVTAMAPDDRDTMVFQSVNAVVLGGERHVFAQDGNSRLVYFRFAADGAVKAAENVTQGTTNASGYFPFQEDFAGRLYTDLAVLPLENPRRLFVYGTNGQDLILYAGRIDDDNVSWSVANLRNDTFSIYGDPDPSNGYVRPLMSSTGTEVRQARVPGNNVFGSPGGYIEANGDRHIFQINADGEVVEYYIEFDEPVPRFHTQNINLRTAKSPALLMTMLNDQNSGNPANALASRSEDDGVSMLNAADPDAERVRRSQRAIQRLQGLARSDALSGREGGTPSERQAKAARGDVDSTFAELRDWLKS